NCPFNSNEPDIIWESWIQIALIDAGRGPAIRESRNFSPARRVWLIVNEPMSTKHEYIEQHTARLEDCFFTRRHSLRPCGMGFGALSLAGLLGERLFEHSANAADAAFAPLAPKLPHFTGKAKRVIHIFAQGAPSQVDTWDPKPVLTANDGKTLPGLNGVAYGSPFKFSKHGRSGLE